MTTVTHSILIQRPIDTVFHFVTNLENDHHWWKASIATRKLTNGSIGMGTQFDQLSKLMGISIHNHLHIVEWSPPASVRYSNTSKQLAYTVDYLFNEENHFTRYRLNATLEIKGILKLLMPLTMRALDKQLNSYFNNLKQYLEAAT